MHRSLRFGLVAAVAAIVAGGTLFVLLRRMPVSAPQKTQTPAAGVKTNASEESVVASVNASPITLAELDNEVDVYNALSGREGPDGKITTRQDKINYLKNDLIRRKLLYQYALQRGLDKKPEVQRALDKTRQDLLAMALLKEEAASIAVTPAEVEAYYTQYQNQLREPEQRRVREIVVATDGEAKDILIDILEGKDFAQLASQRSIAASRVSAGDLGYVLRGEKFPRFDEVVFAEGFTPGSTSNIFSGPGGFYIVKLEAIRSGRQKSLKDAWEDIRMSLEFVKQQQRVEQLLGNLLRDMKIEIYEGSVK